MADFNLSDIGQYFGGSSSPFSGMGNFTVGGETEEERRKRLEREQAQLGNTEVGSTTVKNYADGSQEHTTTTQVPAPVAPAAIAPTATPAQPAPQLAPEHQAAIDQVLPPAGAGAVTPMAAPAQTAPVQQAPVQQAPVQQPVAPVAPAQTLSPGESVVPPAPAQPVAPVNAAAPTPPANAAPAQPPVNAPINPAAPTAPPTTTAQQQAQDMENGPAQADKTMQAWDLLSNPNPDKLAIGKLAYGDYPPHIQKAAEAKLEEVKQHEAGMKRGQELMAGVQSGDPKAVRQFQKEINNPNEGSWGKLILAGLLGNKEAQTAEFAKLGIGSTTHPMIGEDGKEYMVTMNAKGVPIKGVNADGEPLNAIELQNLNAGNTKTLRTQANHAANSVMERLQKENDAVAENNRRFNLNNPLPHSPEKIQQAGNDAFQRTMNVGHGGVPQAPAAAVSTGPTTPTTPSAPAAGGGRVTSGMMNNNPGNIMYGPKAIEMGATDKAPNGTAIFPNMVAGDKAQDDLLSSKAYSNMNLHQIISKWAPNNENNPAQYAKTVKGMLGGIDMDKTYNELTPSEKQTFREAQYKMEHGGEPGVGATAPVRQKTMAEKIASYEMKPPVSRSKDYAPLMNEVLKVNPDYHEQNYKQADNVRTDFTKSSQQSAGGQLNSVNRIIPHTDEYIKVAQALNTHDMPIINEYAAKYKFNAGEGNAAAVRAMAPFIANEYQKAIAGGLGGVDERMTNVKNIENLNPAQLKEALSKLQHLAADQALTLKQKWVSANLPAQEFDGKLVPSARTMVNRRENERNNTRGNW